MSNIDLWLEYILRFSHLAAGIAWIGSSFYFIWLDSAFETPEKARQNVEGEVFMVHGGFYYQVEKKKIYPGELPKVLHWFKWEATITWITGILLLIVVYYFNGASLLSNTLTQPQAISLSLISLIVAWFVYDLIWHPDWMKSKTVSLILSVLAFAGLILFNFHFFSGRGAFIQTGALLGSMMLFNVWVRILPGQRKMLKAAEAGQIPDYSVSLKSKTRSVHNTYFIFPVLFIMLSNHYPQIYNHQQNWLLLIVLSVSSAIVRHTMVSKVKAHRWLLVPAAAGLIYLLILTAPTKLSLNSNDSPVEYSQVRSVFEAHCISCHSAKPTDEIFKETPKGLSLEFEDQIQKSAELIYQQVVVSKVMPLANKTQMTEEERELIRRYLKR